MQFMDTLRGLVNTISGLGSDRDKAAHGNWHYTPLERIQIEAAYRSNWMCRKAVDIPAFDMMREGWAWQADENVVEKIEAEEKRLRVRKSVLQALKQARLYGGAAILISDGKGQYATPLEPNRVGQGGISFLKVLDRHHLTSGPLDTDPLSQNYMEPEYYELTGTAGGTTRIHPSRVIRFIGAELPTDWEMLSDRWGDSILDAIEIAIRDATAGQQGIAALVQEAKVDVFRVHGFMEGMKSEQYKKAVEDRFGLVNRLKSTVNAIVLDMEDEYQQKTANFTNLPDVQRLQLQIVSGAADIPATRFLGQSPVGMNATGTSDLENYYNRIQAEQELMLRDVLERLFGFVVRSALGNFPADLWFRFRPLWQVGEKERSEIFKAKADAARAIAGNGQSPALMPIEALSDALVNALTEDGSLPGLEAAIDEYGKLADQEEDEEESAAALPAPANGNEQARIAANDAEPRTLYVRRDVLNAEDIIAHFKAQGFETTLPADDMHVTITFSRKAVDWMKMGDNWSGNEKGRLTINAGGPRMMDRFGQAGEATVLLFASSHLSWRHEEMVREGATWDHPEYQPHITISYGAGEIDLSKVEPYRGQIVLGPELFAEVKEDWAEGLKDI